MFEPEHVNVTCPKCHRPEMYFDRETGFYCMFCGQQFSREWMEQLMAAEMVSAMRRDSG